LSPFRQFVVQLTAVDSWKFVEILNFIFYKIIHNNSIVSKVSSTIPPLSSKTSNVLLYNLFNCTNAQETITGNNQCQITSLNDQINIDTVETLSQKLQK